MRVVVKGLSCQVSYGIIPKSGGIDGYSEYLGEIEKFKGDFDAIDIEEENENYDIVKKIKVVEEPLLKILEDYPTKPNKGDIMGVDGVRYEILDVVCWDDGVIEVVVDKMVNEEILDESLEDIKIRAGEESISDLWNGSKVDESDFEICVGCGEDKVDCSCSTNSSKCCGKGFAERVFNVFGGVKKDGE